MPRRSMFEFAGGEPAFLALATAHHKRCLEDPVLNHPFSHPGHPQHVERLAGYWAEVFGHPRLTRRRAAGSRRCSPSTKLIAASCTGRPTARLPRQRRTAMAYDVTMERTTECPTAVVKANTTWREFPSLWRTLLDEVWAFLGATPGLRTDGQNVMLYRHNIPGVEVAVEVGVQVTASFDAAGRVVPSVLPAGEAATTVHTGTPAEIGAAHEAVRAWCSAQRRAVTGVSWEIYGDPDPTTGHFDTAVYWQLA